MGRQRVVTKEELENYSAEHPDATLADYCRRFGRTRAELTPLFRRYGLPIPPDPKLDRDARAVYVSSAPSRTIRVVQPDVNKPYREPMPAELPLSQQAYDDSVAEYRQYTPAESAKYGHLGPIEGRLQRQADQLLALALVNKEMERKTHNLTSKLERERREREDLEDQLAQALKRNLAKDLELSEKDREIEARRAEVDCLNDLRDSQAHRIHELDTEVKQALEFRKQELETTYSPETLRIAKDIDDEYRANPRLEAGFPSSRHLAAATLRLINDVPGHVSRYGQVIQRLDDLRWDLSSARDKFSRATARAELADQFLGGLIAEYRRVVQGGQPGFPPYVDLQSGMLASMLFGTDAPRLLSHQEARTLILRFSRDLGLAAIKTELDGLSEQLNSSAKRFAALAPGRSASPAPRFGEV